MPTDPKLMPEPSHILVVDDSATQLRQIQFLLEKEGYVVQTAMDGVEALSSIEEIGRAHV